MSYSFDGVNKLIVPLSTASFTVKDLYSRWKEWVLDSDNSKYIQAFRSVAGDPIGVSQSIAPYIFLNTAQGWRMRPFEASHEVTITGNLYSEDFTLPLFVPTLGTYTVLIILERSSAAIAITLAGVDQANVQAALTAQGYTTSRATKLDNLDVLVSTTGLTAGQATMLLEIYELMGLDPLKPLVVTPVTRKVPAAGTDINQTITTVGTTVTVQRL